MQTTSLSLCWASTRNQVTAQKQLWIDSENVKNAYESLEIDYVAFVRSDFNIANAPTRYSLTSQARNSL